MRFILRLEAHKAGDVSECVSQHSICMQVSRTRNFQASVSPAQNKVARVAAASFWYPDGQRKVPLASRESF